MISEDGSYIINILAGPLDARPDADSKYFADMPTGRYLYVNISESGPPYFIYKPEDGWSEIETRKRLRRLLQG